MTPNTYQNLARRTRCSQSTVFEDFQTKFQKSLFENHPENTKTMICTPEQGRLFIHALIGLSGEVGELATEAQRFGWYKQELNVTNLKEELGDLMWYVCEMCDALNLKLEDVMEANIGKLAKRYPEKFTEFLAAEENRNRKEEAQTVRKTIAQDDGVCYE